MNIGVLALQGAFKLHRPHLDKLSVGYRAVTRAKHLDSCDGLILPGGESTTLLKLLHHQKMMPALEDFVRTKPTWGICAGLILLSQTVKNPRQHSFKALPISVIRNGYGRQTASHNTLINGYTVSFIRAPVIEKAHDGINILHTKEGSPTWIESGHVMGTTFHPELNTATPSPWHKRFALVFCGHNEKT